MLSPALDVRVQTAETDAYLRALVPPDGDHRPIPAAAYNVAAQLLAVEAGIDTHEPVARVHLVAGTWMSLRAARARGATDVEPDIAVTIEPTSPSERLSLFARCHGFTPRETALVEKLAARGRHPHRREVAVPVRTHRAGPPRVDLRQNGRTEPADAAQPRRRPPTPVPTEPPAPLPTPARFSPRDPKLGSLTGGEGPG